MAESGRARVALARNLPKRGWSFEGNEGTFQDLKIVLGEDGWVMTKTEGGKQVDVATGAYGRVQMNDVKKAAQSAGQPFAGESQTVDPEKKKLMAQKRTAKMSARQKETFIEILSKNGWEHDTKNVTQYKRDAFTVVLAPESWSMSKGKKQVCEGTYASKAYAVIESALEEKAS